MAQFETARTESTKILPLDLEAERKKTELPSPFDINGVHFASTERTRSWRLLSTELFLFLVPYTCEPHSSAASRCSFYGGKRGVRSAERATKAGKRDEEDGNRKARERERKRGKRKRQKRWERGKAIFSCNELKIWDMRNPVFIERNLGFVSEIILF